MTLRSRRRARAFSTRRRGRGTSAEKSSCRLHALSWVTRSRTLSSQSRSSKIVSTWIEYTNPSARTLKVSGESDAALVKFLPLLHRHEFRPRFDDGPAIDLDDPRRFGPFLELRSAAENDEKPFGAREHHRRALRLCEKPDSLADGRCVVVPHERQH